MKPYMTVLGLLVVAVAAWIITSNTQVAREEKPIKIGVILPLSGDLAFIGEAGRNAAELALQEVNKNPAASHRYELVIEDDGFDAKKTASAVTKLTSIDNVDVLISVSSTGGNVVAPIAQEKGIPHIGLASDAAVAKGDYNFIHWTRPQEEVDLMLEELSKRGQTKVAIIGVSQQGFAAITKDFVEKAPAKNIVVVDNQEFPQGTKDFKTLLTKAEEQQPDIYILNAFSPELEILGRQMNELGIQTPRTSVESFGLSNNPEVFEGEWYIDSAVTESSFNEKYRAMWNVEPGPTAGNIYDAVHLLVGAVEETGKGAPSGADIMQALQSTNGYEGAFGRLTVSVDGAFISTPSVKVIRDGKPGAP